MDTYLITGLLHDSYKNKALCIHRPYFYFNSYNKISDRKIGMET